MKPPNTEQAFSVEEIPDDWTAEQLLAHLRNQYKHLTAPDGRIRRAVAATDDDIRDIANEIATLEKQVAAEKSNPMLASDFEAKPPLEKLEVQRRWLEELCANNNEKALLVGYSLAQLVDIRAGLDKWERDFKEWQRRENAKKILGLGFDQTRNRSGDEMLKFLDKFGRKSLFFPPKNIPGKKDN